MPKELIPTAIIKAMIPYADSNTAHSLELLLQTEQIRTSFEQTIQCFHDLQDSILSSPPPPATASSDLDGEYELAANEFGNPGNRMDLEGMIQAVQAVCGKEEHRKLDQLLMVLRIRKILSVSHDPTLMFDALSALLSPEQKKQVDELLPLITMLQEGTIPL